MKLLESLIIGIIVSCLKSSGLGFIMILDSFREGIY